MAMIISAGFATLVAGVLTAVVLFANGMRSSPGEFVGGGLIKGSWLAAALLWGIVAATSALAHDRNRPHLNEWLKSLHSNGKVWCCDGSDTDEIDDWDTKDGRYRVKFRGLWYDVPPDAVVDGPNKSGTPLLWMYKGYMSPTVRCFMPGAMT